MGWCLPGKRTLLADCFLTFSMNLDTAVRTTNYAKYQGVLGASAITCRVSFGRFALQQNPDAADPSNRSSVNYALTTNGTS